MAIFDLLDDAKKTVNDLKKKYKFHYLNKKREEAAGLIYDVNACQGRLGACKREFNRIIKEQSKAVREGRVNGMDVFIQQNMLHDAAVGYLLVRDAMFALNSVSSTDSIAHAYELLETATLQMQGKKPLKDLIPGVANKKGDRDKYGFLTADATLADKNAYIATFFDELIQTGDIDKCIEKSKPVPIHDGNILSGEIGSDSMDEFKKQLEEIRKLDAGASSGSKPVDYMSFRDDITNADAPKSKKEIKP